MYIFKHTDFWSLDSDFSNTFSTKVLLKELKPFTSQILTVMVNYEEKMAKDKGKILCFSLEKILNILKRKKNEIKTMETCYEYIMSPLRLVRSIW